VVLVARAVRSGGVAPATPVSVLRGALFQAARAAASAAVPTETVDRAEAAAVPTVEETQSRAMRAALTAQWIRARPMQPLAQEIRARPTQEARLA
jgi:hypothetical protein